MGRFWRRRNEERPDRILSTVHVDLFVAGIEKSHELLGLVGERIKPLAECDRHYPVAPAVEGKAAGRSPLQFADQSEIDPSLKAALAKTDRRAPRPHPQPT